MKIVLTAFTLIVVCLIYVNGCARRKNKGPPYKYKGKFLKDFIQYIDSLPDLSRCLVVPVSEQPGTEMTTLHDECKEGDLFWTFTVSNPGPDYVLKVSVPGSNQKLCIQRIKIGQTICENSKGNTTTATLQGDPNGIGNFTTFSEEMRYTVTSLS